MSSLRSESSVDFVEKSQQWLGQDLPRIRKAKQSANEKVREIAELLARKRSIPEDVSFVVYGSLARGEWTSGSDLDWSLLVDGAVDPSHLKAAQQLQVDLKELDINAPGREGVFGNLSFSHDLVHHIGGQDDTNRNLTQRILLLLESRPIGDEQAYERVIRSILGRYCEEDSHLYSFENHHFKVPRFLLNDVVRFWRTMAVDFASKRRERNSQGWALRSAKLRLSRKLLFSAGLVMCLRCRMAGIPGEKGALFGQDFTVEPLINFIAGFVDRTALDIMAEVLLEQGNVETARAVLISYDKFLGILDDVSSRQELDRLGYEQAETSPVFVEVRKIGKEFQKGLHDLFFVNNSGLSELVKEYGVF